MNTVATGQDAVLRRVIWMLAPAITLVVATEFIVVGLLPLVAAELDVSLAEAGRLTGVFAFSAAVAGPGVTLLASRWQPRHVLAATLVLFAVGNVVMVVAPNITLMLAARAVQGAALPAFISVGAASVTTLARHDQRGKALAQANVGFVLGVLVALPAGIALAQGGHWRVPFMALIVASLPVLLLVWFRFPTCRPIVQASRAQQLDLLRQPVFLMHLVLSVALFAAMFSSYTFLGAWLEGRLGLGAGGVAIALFLFGAAGLLGNTAAAHVADRVPVQATMAVVILLVLATNVIGLVPSTIAFAVVPLATWSIAHTASVTLSQVRVTLAGGHAPAFAMTLNLSSANLGIALGAFAGGWTIDRWGMVALGWATSAFALVTVALCIAVLVRAGGARQPAGSTGTNHAGFDT